MCSLPHSAAIARMQEAVGVVAWWLCWMDAGFASGGESRWFDMNSGQFQLIPAGSVTFFGRDDVTFT